MAEAIEVNGTKYRVVERMIVADMVETHPAYVAMLLNSKIDQLVIAKRPRGRKHTMFYRFESGSYRVAVSCS